MLLVLSIFWFILSGQTELFFLTSGIISILAAIAIDRKLFDKQFLLLGFKFRWVKVGLIILKEIFVSSLTTTKLIWLNPSSINPCISWIECSSKQNRVLYANSITLTPGTMTIYIKDNKLLVHALNTQSLNELKNGLLEKKLVG